MTTAGAYLPWEGEVTSVTKISKSNSPFHEAKHQLEPAQETMQNTLSITDKFASSGGPSSGDGGWSQSGDMQWDVDANPNFPSDIEQSLDPANSGEPNLGDNMQAFDDAVQAVRSILNENKGDNSCAKFFGGVGEDALNKIVAMVSEKNFVPLSDAATGINMGVGTIGSADLQMPSTGYMTTDPAYVWINTRGPFVNGQAKRIGHQFSATLKSRVLQILHEIGHLVVTGVTRGEVKRKVGGEMRTYKVSNLTLLLDLDGSGSDSGLSVDNTEKVEEACGKQINALDKKKS